MLKSARLLIPLALIAALPARAGESGSSDWVRGQISSARLIAAGGLESGVYRAGVEIALDGRAHTYWRNPGEAGAPPVFKFDGSVNLAEARARFPAPTRITEDGSDIFGYLQGVVFPIEVTPRDPARPVELVLDLRYAACERICIPVEAQTRLTLAPSDAPTAVADRVNAANAALPKPIAIGGPALRATLKAGGDKPTWSIAVDPPASAGADLFSEAPESWFFDTKRVAAGGFELILEEKPSDAKGPVDVDLTLVDGARAFVTSIRLDASAAKP